LISGSKTTIDNHSKNDEIPYFHEFTIISNQKVLFPMLLLLLNLILLRNDIGLTLRLFLSSHFLQEVVHIFVAVDQDTSTLDLHLLQLFQVPDRLAT
jgi:hypothetical protein